MPAEQRDIRGNVIRPFGVIDLEELGIPVESADADAQPGRLYFHSADNTIKYKDDAGNIYSGKQGDVSNPMAANLDAGGNDINNVGALEADEDISAAKQVQAKINGGNSDAIIYSDVGQNLVSSAIGYRQVTADNSNSEFLANIDAFSAAKFVILAVNRSDTNVSFVDEVIKYGFLDFDIINSGGAVTRSYSQTSGGFSVAIDDNSNEYDVFVKQVWGISR